jgi:hypothetical protein
MLTTCWLP